MSLGQEVTEPGFNLLLSQVTPLVPLLLYYTLAHILQQCFFKLKD
jgi:hypothetical protein